MSEKLWEPAKDYVTWLWSGQLVHLLICNGGEAFIIDCPADFCSMTLC